MKLKNHTILNYNLRYLKYNNNKLGFQVFITLRVKINSNTDIINARGVAGAEPPLERVARNEVRARGRPSPPYEIEERK